MILLLSLNYSSCFDWRRFGVFVVYFRHISHIMLVLPFPAGYLLRSTAEPINVFFVFHPTGIYLFKTNNGNTRSMCEICSKGTIRTLEWRHWRRSVVFIVYFWQISHIMLVFSFPAVYLSTVLRFSTGPMYFLLQILLNLELLSSCPSWKATMVTSASLHFCCSAVPFQWTIYLA